MTTPTVDQIREQLNATHGLLLDIHKALIDFEKVRYEGEHGAVGTPNDLLQLIIRDPFFAWLRPMTSLLVEIDEFVSARPPRVVPPVEEGVALLAQARAMLVPREEGEGFQRAYARALQDSPEVAHTHGAWKLFVAQLPVS
jgi:hypothetical protein